MVKDRPWYVEWRSLPFTEVFSSLCAPIFGYIFVRATARLSIGRDLVRLFIIGVGALLIFIPFAKPILLPVAMSHHWVSRWQDGICLQTTPSTCGPATLATLLAGFGIHRSECKVARATFACASGTELWYLMRYARKQGLHASYRTRSDISQVHAPAIIGTNVGDGGHFISLLRAECGCLTIGDPMGQKLTISAREFNQHFTFSGQVVELRVAKP